MRRTSAALRNYEQALNSSRRLRRRVEATRKRLKTVEE